jgi:hypothetical protein
VREVIGVDIVPELVEEGRKRGHGDLRRLPPYGSGARRPPREEEDVHGRHRSLHGASVAAALAPSADRLIPARAVRDVGGAIVTPLTSTILSAAVSKERRGLPQWVVRHRQA